VGLGMLAAAGLGGCPPSVAPLEFITGGTGQATVLRDTASVEVLTPASDLSITGGTQVEVNWRAFATSRFAVLNVIIDPDQDPQNGNEITAFTNVPLSQTSALVDTTRLQRGTYSIGVTLEEAGEMVASGYAPGQITIDQRPRLFFTSPRDSFTFDRTPRITPRFNVAWQLNDPDSVDTVQILLDPDDTPNGNEALLHESNSQSTDSFSFDLPTALLEPGTYRLLALVSDGQNAFPFYAPGTIRIRGRLAGFIDLRDMDLPSSAISGAIFEGFNPRDNAGSFVTSAEDIDGDGFRDFFILSQFGKPYYVVNIQRTGIGEGYLIYGRQRRFSGVNNLNSTGTLFRGEIYAGVPEAADPIRPSRGITSFTVIDDWDGDGIREFAFGMPFTDSVGIGPLDPDGYFRTGAVVIAAGETLAGFAGRNVFNLAEFGNAPSALPTGFCREGFYGPKAPSSLGYYHGAVTAGCRISTCDFNDQCGHAVSRYDFNSIIISVPNRDPVVNTGVGQSVPGAGVVSVYFAPTGFNPWDADNTVLPHQPFNYVLDDQRFFLSQVGLSRASPGYWSDPGDVPPPCPPLVQSLSLPVPERTTRIYGGFAGAAIGNAVSIGDFNADALQDFLVGSPQSHNGAGSCFIVLGRLLDLVLAADLPIEELALPMNDPNRLRQRVFDGIRVVGAPGDRLGESQSDAGDFNNDGIADVAIGSPLVNNRRGGAAIFFGSRTVINLTETEIPFDELPARNLGVIFAGEEEGDFAGARVVGVGDVDGDGNDDLLIAAPNRSVSLDIDLDGTLEIDRAGCGVVYLIYGAPDLHGTLSLADVGTERLPGAVFIGRNSGDHLGAGLGLQGDRSHGVAGARDIDGDGLNDILISSVSASPRDRAQAGEVYLLYGVGD